MTEEQKPRLKLYHASPSRASVTMWMLEEVGEPYEVELLSLKNGDQRKPEYLALNPMGKVPLVLDGDVILPADGGTINERRKISGHGLIAVNVPVTPDGRLAGAPGGVVTDVVTGPPTTVPATALVPTPLGGVASGGTTMAGRAGGAGRAPVVTVGRVGGAMLVLGGPPRPAAESMRGDAAGDAGAGGVDEDEEPSDVGMWAGSAGRAGDADGGGAVTPSRAGGCIP